jgi:hypothetical protein
LTVRAGPLSLTTHGSPGWRAAVTPGKGAHDPPGAEAVTGSPHAPGGLVTLRSDLVTPRHHFPAGPATRTPGRLARWIFLTYDHKATTYQWPRPVGRLTCHIGTGSHKVTGELIICGR